MSTSNPVTYAHLVWLWKLPIPAETEALLKIEPNSFVPFRSEKVDVPWPPLSAEEIADAHDLAEEWEIPKGFVPVMGDFHDLVCLAFKGREAPEVVIINDEREELARFSSIVEFMGLVQVAVEGPTDEVKELSSTVVK